MSSATNLTTGDSADIYATRHGGVIMDIIECPCGENIPARWGDKPDLRQCTGCKTLYAVHA
jgi:hypothetical protein